MVNYQNQKQNYFGIKLFTVVNLRDIIIQYEYQNTDSIRSSQ